jgi:hypothetical protein
MNWIPRDILKPFALALVSVFYAMVNHSADSQRGAVWMFDHYDSFNVPFGFKARLKLDLMFDEAGTQQPKRREGEIEALTSDRSADAGRRLD